MKRSLSTKQQMVARLRYLWRWDMFNALALFPGVGVLLWSHGMAGANTVLALASVCALLLAGSGFCLVKYRDLKYGLQRTARCERAFGVMRWVFPVALGAVGLMVIMSAYKGMTAEAAVAIPLLLFAILEYVNFFHVQLMYDNRNDLHYLLRHKALKRGLIAREFGW